MSFRFLQLPNLPLRMLHQLKHLSKANHPHKTVSLSFRKIPSSPPNVFSFSISVFSKKSGIPDKQPKFLIFDTGSKKACIVSPPCRKVCTTLDTTYASTRKNRQARRDILSRPTVFLSYPTPTKRPVDVSTASFNAPF